MKPLRDWCRINGVLVSLNVVKMIRMRTEKWGEQLNIALKETVE